MNLPKNMGRYLATPNNWTVEESGEAKIPTFVCLFDLSMYFDGGEWSDYSTEALQITGYFYLFKKDGSVNTFTIDALKSALNWDGTSLKALAETDWSATEVQLTIGQEEYLGKTKTRVQFINPRDYDGSGNLSKDPALVQTLENRYGAQLRALAGPKRAAPPHTNGNGAAASLASPPATSGASNAAMAARRNAWTAFQKQHPGKTADELAPDWRKLIGEVCPGRDPKVMSGVEWLAVQNRIEEPTNPIEQQPVFAEDDIPF